MVSIIACLPAAVSKKYAEAYGALTRRSAVSFSGMDDFDRKNCAIGNISAKCTKKFSAEAVSA